MDDVNVGDNVETRYGLGTVTRISASGVEVHLRAANAFITLKQWDVTRAPGGIDRPKQTPPAPERTRPAKSLRPVDPLPQPTRPRLSVTGNASKTELEAARLSTSSLHSLATLAPETTRPFRMPEDVRLRQAVEALRFGLVPTAHLDRLTVGYDVLKSWIFDNLPNASDSRPVAAEISGPFGTGKSHACAVVRHIAREMNYVVANVEVDGQRVTLANPSILLNAITSTLHAHDLFSSTPIVELYLRAIAASKSSLKTTRAWDDRARGNFAFVRLANSRGAFPAIAHIVEKILTCSPNFTVGQAKQEIVTDKVLYPGAVSLRPPIGHTLVERPAGFVQSLVAIALAAQMAGYGGLVITIDEFEVERNLQPKERDRVTSLINELAGFMAGRTDHEPAPIAIFFASIGQDGHAGDAIITKLIRSGRGQQHVLAPLTASNRGELGKEAYKLYAEVYGLSETLDGRHIKEVERSLAESGVVDDSGVTRAFIKEFVAVLDRAFGPPAVRAAS